MATLLTDTTARPAARQLLPQRATVILRFIEGGVIAALGLAIYLIYVEPSWLPTDGRYLTAIAAAIVIYETLGHWLGGYEVTARMGDPSHTARALGTWTLTFAILLALAFIMKISSSYSRVWAVGWFLGVSTSLLLLRITLGQWLVRRAEEGEYALRTVIIGCGPEAQELGNLWCRNDNYELRFLGFIDEREADSPHATKGLDLIGNVDRLVEMIRHDLVDQVVIATPRASEEAFSRLLDRLSLTPVRVHVMPFPAKQYILDRNILRICGVPMVEVIGTPMPESARVLKWLEDCVLGSLLLLFVAPLMLVIAVAIKLDSRGPVFFKQIRQGYNDSLFSVWKFRTMYADHTESAFVQTTWDDPRVTAVGNFLRRSSLDELPQLFNVLNGTMSLVGPRPHAPETQAEGRLFADVVDRYAARHRVKPGITGLAQVHGWRGETDSLEKIKRRVEYDLDYIEHWSLWLDLWILAKTVWVILKGENAY